MRTLLATALAAGLTLLAGFAIAQTSPADMGRAGAAARAATAMQDSRMGAAAVTIPRGASMPSMGAAPEPVPQQQVATPGTGGDAGAGAAATAQARGAGDSDASAQRGAGPRLMWGAPSALETRPRRGQCPAGTIRRNEGCVPPGHRTPAY